MPRDKARKITQILADADVSFFDGRVICAWHICPERDLRKRQSPSAGLLVRRQTRANRCDPPPSARLPPAVSTEVHMRRIGLAVVLILSLILAPIAAEAQEAGKLYRIAFLSAGSPRAPHLGVLRTALELAWIQALRDRGWVEG